MESLGASYSPKSTRPAQNDGPPRSTFTVPSYQGPPRQAPAGMDSMASEQEP